MGARDERVRDKGLENSMCLDDLTNYAINREMLLKQKEKTRHSRENEGSGVLSAVDQEWKHKSSTVEQHGTRWNQVKRKEVECDNCGSWKHRNDSRECSARAARCNHCGRIGHYARKCRSRRNVPWNSRRPYRKFDGANSLREGDRYHHRGRIVARRPLPDIPKVHKKDDGIITCKIDTFPVSFLIDSGAAINTLTERDWNDLSKSAAKIYKKRFNCDRQFTAYACQEPLQVVMIFEAWVSVNDNKPKTYAEFFVIQGAKKSLLCKRTAEELKVLQVGLDVCHIELKTNAFPKFPNVQVKLSVDPNVPPRKLAYLRIPVAMEEKVDQKLLEMLHSDVIEPAIGPPEWISPMVVVPKGKSDIRMCINMKYPNQAIQREHYPLPMIDTLLNKLRGSRCFSKLDITSAFHHIELHPDSRGITTFMTGRGLMRFKRLMFGINCAPEIFQRVMTEMLCGIEGIIVYIDDVVVSGRNREEHDARLRETLAVLKENNALLNMENAYLAWRSLKYWATKCPETKEEVRSFLGLVNFIGHFIPDLSTRTEPLRLFIRGEVANFGEHQREAFEDLRNEISNNVQRLGFFDPADKTELYVDASPVGLGAVLTQRNSANDARIVSFASKGLTKTERVYPQTQREALAVVWAVEKFYPYLFGTKFAVFTDHKTLEYIYGGKHQNGKRACTRAEGWALRLQPYDFTVHHIPGSSNISDICSRLCKSSDVPFDETTEHYLCSIGEIHNAITLEEIKTETARDETLSAVIRALATKDWSKELFRYQAFEKELGVIEDIVVREDRIILPLKLRQRALGIAHRGHPGIVAMRRNLRDKVWWPCMDRDVGEFVQQCAGCAAVSRMDVTEPMQRKLMPKPSMARDSDRFFSAKECATFWSSLTTIAASRRLLR
ncbi:uncharacterized protein K02A2.6-like [Armigeres subalbatus]|uniref:uncharacterized protein K02A2.6-like n=1 Tax=Armigeres subalbatus TaxID=124917 RepID=UPI002ED05F68